MGAENEDVGLLLLDYYAVYCTDYDLMHHYWLDHIVWLVESIVLDESSLGDWELGWYGAESREWG